MIALPSSPAMVAPITAAAAMATRCRTPEQQPP
eukprot:CAMPEP_0180514260 /NCGR_PEP_ID=MMETSP1036_2-20121128/52628_1 /TAXON_ID=632150 /ORGANISM="Azadinium spinosum, Strain 3D9" /LENGTH=32 /DNA_ID= /DNA_START= /DNA_END= /DNA_ORIENTATION=